MVERAYGLVDKAPDFGSGELGRVPLRMYAGSTPVMAKHFVIKFLHLFTFCV